MPTDAYPLHGPRVEEIIKKLQSGKDVDQLQYVDESIFAVDDTVTSIEAETSLGETSKYDVTVVTQDVIDGRAY